MGITLDQTERKPLPLWYNITAEIACYRNRNLVNSLFAKEHVKRHYRLMTQTRPSIQQNLDLFTRSLAGAKSRLTIQAYESDLRQFFTWITETDSTATDVHHIYRCHIEDYLAALADKGQTGTTRARKLIALQVFFAMLVEKGMLPESPARKIKRPKREQKSKHFLRP